MGFPGTARRKATGLARLLGIGRLAPRVGPRYVYLQLTHACNLACEFCESHGKHVETPVTRRLEYYDNRSTMDRRTALGLIQELARMGVRQITLSGRGEPVIHPDILEIIVTIERAGIRAKLVTNGVIPGKEFARALVDAGCWCVNTSINAATPDTFHVVCGKPGLSGGFETVRGFVQDLLEARRKKGTGWPTVRITNVIYRNNYRDLPGMVAQACEDHVDSVGFTLMGTIEETEFLKIDDAGRRWISGASGDWGPRLSEAGVDHNLGQFLRVVRGEERSIRTEDNLQRHIPCYAGWTETAIGPDGSVRACCYCDDPLGNIHREGGFGNVWRNPAYRLMRERSLEMHRTGRPICRECFTTCNNAPANLRVYRRLHPFRRKELRELSAKKAVVSADVS